MEKGSERLKPGKSIVKSSIIKSGINIQEFTKMQVFLQYRSDTVETLVMS